MITVLFWRQATPRHSLVSEQEILALTFCSPSILSDPNSCAQSNTSTEKNRSYMGSALQIEIQRRSAWVISFTNQSWKYCCKQVSQSSWETWSIRIKTCQGTLSPGDNNLPPLFTPTSLLLSHMSHVPQALKVEWEWLKENEK